MAKARTRTVHLKAFFEEYDKKNATNFSELIEFDDDEYLEVIPNGAISRRVSEEVFRAYDRPMPWTDEDRNEADRARRARDCEAVVKANIHGFPSELTPDDLAAMSPDLESAVTTVAVYAFQRKEDKLERLGEGNGSSAPSKDEVITVS